MLRPTNAIANSIEVLLFLAGCVLLWRFVLSPAARSRPQAMHPVAWQVPFIDFLLFGFVTLSGMFLALLLAPAITPESMNPDLKTVILGGLSQFGMLGGVVIAHFAGGRSGLPETRRHNFFLSGFVTFLIVLPLVAGASLIWRHLLQRAGLPEFPQELVELFERPQSRPALWLMVVLATVVAPVTEELIFRQRLFGWLRGRVSRSAALWIAAIFFAALHVAWQTTLKGLDGFVPLVVLAVGFAVAYERTGHIGTPIVAHGLFNLHSIVYILLQRQA